MDKVKSLILLRGLPGSGKSSLAKILCEEGKYPVTSIDNFFINPQTGEYVFEYDRNHLAYKNCEEQTRQYLLQGHEKVFVDHAFTMEWEMEPYFKMAAASSYRVFVVTVENRHGSGNVHNITREQLEKMAVKYKVCLLPDS